MKIVMNQSIVIKLLFTCMSGLFVFSPMETAWSDQPVWAESSTGSSSSLRGLVVASADSSIWASGSKGTILRSNDLGRTWHFVGPAAHPELEFRSLYAWDERHAIVASAGTPAVVLKTKDAGKSWREVHRDAHPKAFFDGMKFIDSKRGVLFGDPIEGRFVVLTTRDSGETWQAVERQVLPDSLTEEAAFAASNSAMIVAEPATIMIGTGGYRSAHSRLLVSRDFGSNWQVKECPLASSPTSGVFSLALSSDGRTLVAVGGDYQPDAKSSTTAALSNDDSMSFTAPLKPPSGFRSSVVFARGKFLATGPAGTDFSNDGSTWIPMSNSGYHAMAVLPDGRIVAVGSSGRFGVCAL